MEYKDFVDWAIKHEWLEVKGDTYNYTKQNSRHEWLTPIGMDVMIGVKENKITEVASNINNYGV
jgi:hypothetical protein